MAALTSSYTLLPSATYGNLGATVAASVGYYRLMQVSVTSTLTAVILPPGLNVIGRPSVCATAGSVDLAATTGTVALGTNQTTVTLATPLTLIPGQTYAVGVYCASVGATPKVYNEPANQVGLWVTATPGVCLEYETSFYYNGTTVTTTTTGVSGTINPATLAGTASLNSFAIGLVLTAGTQVPSCPGISVLFSPDPPFQTNPVWQDMSSWVRQITTSAGRQHELLTTQASQATITLDNRDDRFSPWNTNSPYNQTATGLTPTSPIQVNAAWQGVIYPIFTGYIDSLTPEWSNSQSMDMKIAASDLLGLLAVNNMSTTLYQETVLGYSPVFYWRCGDPPGSTTVTDSSGNGYNEVCTGLTYGQTGALPMNVGTAIQLKASFANTGWFYPASQLSSSGWTFTCWFQVPAASTGGTNITTILNGSAVLQNSIYINNGQIFVYNATTGYAGVGPTTLNDGNWHFLVVSLKSSSPGGVWVDDVYYSCTTAITTSGNYAGCLGQIGEDLAPYTLTVQEVAFLPSTVFTNGDGNVKSLYTAAGGLLLAEQYSGQAIYNGLSILGVPSTICALTSAGGNIATGQSEVQPPGGGVVFNTNTPSLDSTVQATSLTSTDGATYSQQCATSENGYLFVNPAGVLTFYDRHYPIDGTGTNAASIQATFENASTSSYFYVTENFAPVLDNLDMWNEVIGAVQPITGDSLATGATQAYENLTSQANYGKRSYPQLTALLLTTDQEALYLCQWVGTQYGNPLGRVQSIRMTSYTPNVLPQQLGRGLWDQIAVVYHSQTGGTEFYSAALIEGIDHDFDSSKAQWSTTFRLSPAEVLGQTTSLVLNSTPYGELNYNVLAY